MVAEAPLRATRGHKSAIRKGENTDAESLTCSHRMVAIIDISTRKILHNLVCAKIHGVGRTCR